MENTNSQLTDQNTVLRAQLAASSMIPTIDQMETATTPLTTGPEKSTEIHNELFKKIKLLEDENSEKEAELERIRKDQDDLLELLTDQDLKLTTFKNRLRELGETIEDGDSDNNSIDSENES